MKRAHQTEIRRLGLAAAGAALWIGDLVAPAIAVEPAGATFVDDAPLVDTASAGSPYTIPVHVLNGSVNPVTFTLTVVALNLPPDSSALPLISSPEPNGVVGRSGVIDPGTTWATELTLNIPAKKTGSNSGRLIVYADDGSITRRDFALTIEQPSAAPGAVPCPTIAPSPPAAPSGSVNPTSSATGCPSPAPGSLLAEPFLGTVIVGVERALMSHGNAPAAIIAVDPALASRLVPGALTSDTGEVATMMISPTGVISLVGQGPGAYKGKLARAAIHDEKAPVALTDLVLNVRVDQSWRSFSSRWASVSRS